MEEGFVERNDGNESLVIMKIEEPSSLRWPWHVRTYKSNIYLHKQARKSPSNRLEIGEDLLMHGNKKLKLFLGRYLIKTMVLSNQSLYKMPTSRFYITFNISFFLF